MRQAGMRFFSLGLLTFVATLMGGFFLAGEDASAAPIRKNCARCKDPLVLSPDGACIFGNPSGGVGCYGWCTDNLGHTTCFCFQSGTCALGVIGW